MPLLEILLDPLITSIGFFRAVQKYFKVMFQKNLKLMKIEEMGETWTWTLLHPHPFQPGRQGILYCYTFSLIHINDAMFYCNQAFHCSAVVHVSEHLSEGGQDVAADYTYSDEATVNDGGSGNIYCKEGSGSGNGSGSKDNL